MRSSALPFWSVTLQLLERVKLDVRMRALIRTYVRNTDIGHIVVAAGVGVAVGLLVVLVQEILRLLHSALFGISVDERLSETAGLSWKIVLLVPCLGGLCYGIVAHLLRRWRARETVDAIEANALHGGQMSLTDSLRLTTLTILSAGVGASVGLEAAYTQLGSGFASRMGRLLKLRRGDLRTLVGCGAAAAIAAAFNAPLAGAFYAFELIIGSYTLATLAPIAIAALAATIVSRQVFGAAPIFVVAEPMQIVGLDYPIFAILGVASAGLAILVMKGVSMVEALFRRLALPAWLRPGIGGLLLGAIALFYPQVLGSGHGGILAAVGSGFPLQLALGLIVAKTLASAISIGSGFRGGMFSSSLLIGALFGQVVGALTILVLPGIPPNPTVFTLVGMGAVAAGVVGAPVTMILLVLEATADFSATTGVMVAVILSSFVVRTLFGYSFATWRFHLRGIPLRSAHDVGWIHDMTVAKLMRRDQNVVAHDLPLSEIRRLFPLGATKRLFVAAEDGTYLGIIDLAEAHEADHDAKLAELTAADLAEGKAHFLLPDYAVRTALDLFVTAEVEVLPVLAGIGDRQLVGYLTEAYALRRYNRELEQRRGEELGETSLYGPAPPI